MKGIDINPAVFTDLSPEESRADIDNWRDCLKELHTEPEGGSVLAKAAGECVGGKWSVDVLESADGLYVTNMAIAERSWGWRESE